MLWFKRFEGRRRDDSGHSSLAEKIKKHQFNFRPLTGKAITAPECGPWSLRPEVWKIIRPTKTYT
jgi:hypothetical protein